MAEHGPQERPFALASVTKLLTAWAVLVAAEEETVHLDRPAGPSGSTVRHLLAHASGLGPEPGDGVLAEPGRRRIYSNAAFEVVADLVADGAGMAFADYLSGAVLDPLGMRTTTLAGSPAHGATATAADLSRFAVELLAPTVLAPATVDAATSVAFPGLAGVLPGYGRQEPNDWGLGFELRAGKSSHWTGAANSPTTFGHFGQRGSFLWVDPTAALALVVLTDRPFGSWAVEAWPRLADAVLAAQPPGRRAHGP